MAIESDRCRIMSGIRHGVTLGSPVCLEVENEDFVNWNRQMSPDPVPEGSEDTVGPVTVPRPGHADLGGVEKYGHKDIRDVLERASARETTARVAGGAVCRRLVADFGVEVRSRVVSIGAIGLTMPHDQYTDPNGVDWDAVEESPVRCEDVVTSSAMCEAIDAAREAGESLGGVFEVWCWGVCPGLGGYVTAESRLDARLVGAMVSIPAIKGAEIGRAFDNAGLSGSKVHDELVLSGNRSESFIRRETNRAGGVEGGMTTGMPIVVRAAMKPIPTLTCPLRSVDLESLEQSRAHVERSDVTAVPAAAVVGEAMMAYVVAAAYLEKFGGDSMDDLVKAVRAYERGLGERGLWRRS